MRKICLLCFALFACGDDEASFDLDERRFTLQSGYQVVAGTTPRLTFDEGQLGFFGGCNAQSGAFEIKDGKLVVGDWASDLIGCEAALAAQDTFFATFLTSRPAFALEGTTLTLTGSNATLVFVEAP